ncbi:MAG: Crp/Fnr family transcriptional regulator [Burkholderiales bacterium]
MDSETDSARLIELFPVFGEMPPPARERVLREAQLRRVPAGTPMFSAGNPCSGFPLLIDGTVRVARLGANGREVQLYKVHPGEACIMSTGCLLGDVEYGATGTAEDAVTVVMLPPRLFNELMRDDDAFRRWVFALFSERLSGMMELVEAVAFQRLDRRIAAQLIASGPVVHTTQQKLADDLGTVREIIGRVLRNFEDRGLVELSRSQIRILDRPGLEAIAGAA